MATVVAAIAQILYFIMVDFKVIILNLQIELC